MTLDEAVTCVQYAARFYPSARLTQTMIDSLSSLWATEFQSDPADAVWEAFRVASKSSPEWMPGVPMIRSAMESIASMPKPRSADDSFKDSHGGKTQAEWTEYKRWSESDEGREMVELYKQKLRALVGI